MGTRDEAGGSGTGVVDAERAALTLAYGAFSPSGTHQPAPSVRVPTRTPKTGSSAANRPLRAARSFVQTVTRPTVQMGGNFDGVFGQVSRPTPVVETGNDPEAVCVDEVASCTR